MSMVVCVLACVPSHGPEQLGEPVPAGVVARLGSTNCRIDYDWMIRPVISPDGRWVLTPTAGELHDARTGRRSSRHFWAMKHEYRFCITHDSKLARRFEDGGRGEWQTFDPATGRRLHASPLPMVGVLTFSRSGRVAVMKYGQPEADITVHDEKTGRLVTPIRTGVLERAFVALSDDGKWLATSGTVGRRREVRVWDADTGELVSSFAVGNSRVLTALFSRDSKSLLVGNGMRVEFWDWRAKRVTRALAGQPGLKDLYLSPDGNTLVAAYEPHGARLWSLDSDGGAVTTGAPFRPTTSVGFTAEGRVLGCERDGQAYALRDLRTGRVVHETSGHRTRVSDLYFQSRDRLLSVDMEGLLGEWSLPGGESRMRRLVPPAAEQNHSEDYRFRFSPRAGFVAELRAEASLYQLADGKKLFETPGWDGQVRPTFYGETGFVSLTFVDDEGRIQLYRLPSGEGNSPVPFSLPKDTTDRRWRVESFTLSDRSPPLLAVRLSTVSRKGERGPGQAELHVLGLSGEPLAGFRPFRHEYPHHRHLQFSPCGQLLMTVSDSRHLHLLHARTGRLLTTVKTTMDFNPVAWSPSGSLLAIPCSRGVIGSSRRVELWEVATGRPLFALPETDRKITALAFSPCGRYLAAGDEVGLIHVWDLAYPWKVSQSPTPAELWAALDSDDPEAAFAAMGALARSPRVALRLLRERLRPAEWVGRALIKRLIEHLDSDEYATRQHARAELEKLGEAAELEMSAALGSGPSAEARRHLTRLLDAIARSPYPRRLARPVRAVAVLGWIGTHEAHSLLRLLTAGDSDSPLTWAAGAALRAGVEANRVK